MDEFTLALNSPITEEQWDTIADVDFDHTNEITFHTKHGKQVVFVKRMRGRWIEIQAPDSDGNALYECSICHSGEVHVPIVEVPFCWHCGARMDGGEA